MPGDRPGHHVNKNEALADGGSTQREKDQAVQQNSTPSPQHQPKEGPKDSAQVAADPEANTTPSSKHRPERGPVDPGQEKR